MLRIAVVVVGSQPGFEPMVGFDGGALSVVTSTDAQTGEQSATLRLGEVGGVLRVIAGQMQARRPTAIDAGAQQLRRRHAVHRECQARNCVANGLGAALGKTSSP